MHVKNKPFILLVAMSFILYLSNAQPIASNTSKTHSAAHKTYDWTNIIQIDIDKVNYPGKYKVVEDIINHLAADAAGQQIFENIARNNDGKILIKDKEDVLKANAIEGVNGMFSADYGLQVIKQDMKYNPIDNELVLNFGKSGEMLSFDEQKHTFFKVSLNSTIATELESAGAERTTAEKNCRLLRAKMAPDEKFLFNNYKDLMGEKFSDDDIAHCRGKKITIHNFKSGTNDPYTFTDNVTDALIAYRNYVAEYKENAYSRNVQEMPLARKYTDKLGEPHRSREAVFNVRLGENRSSRPLQFGPVTGTDYIAVGNGQQNVYKNLSVFYDTEDGQTVNNPTALTSIKEEYVAQLKYNTEALNSPKMLEYVDRLKKYFNKDYKANTDYEAIKDAEVAKVMHNNPYLEGANKVIEAEVMWSAMKEENKKSKK